MSCELEKHPGPTQLNPQFHLFRCDLLAENKTFLNIPYPLRSSKEKARRTKDEGRRTKDEGRRTKDEGERPSIQLSCQVIDN